MFQKKVHYVSQLGSMDCGIACLTMILNYYGCKSDLVDIGAEIQIGRDGMTLAQMKKIAEKHGFKFAAYQYNHEEKNLIEYLPAILCNDSHYVVVDKTKKKGKYILFDPANGRRVVDFLELRNGYKDILVSVIPSRNIKKIKKTKFKIEVKFSQFIIAIMLMLMCQLITLAVPMVVQKVIDSLSSVHITIHIWKITLLVLLIMCAHFVLSLLRQKILLNNMIHKIFRLDVSFFEWHSAGDIGNRFNSINQLNDILTNGFINIIIQGITSLVCLAVMTSISPYLTAFVVAGSIIQIAIMILLNSKNLIKTKEYIYSQSAIQGEIIDTLENIMEIKCMGMDNAVKSNLQNSYTKLIEKFKGKTGISNLMNSFSSSLNLIFPLMIYLIGSYSVEQGEITIGQLIAYVTLVGYFTAPFTTVVLLLPSINSIKEVLLRYKELMIFRENYHTGALVPGEFKNLKMSSVSYCYNSGQVYALNNVSLDLRRGERIAIVGLSGSGKSTLIKAILGAVDINQGCIEVNNYDIRSMSKEQIYKWFSVVTQNPMCLNASIRKNIDIIGDVPDEKIWKVLDIVALKEEVLSMPLGLDTLVGEGGQNISGGQKQRIAIARALLSDTEVVIFDEATSNLDQLTEKKIYDNLRSTNKTQIIITHRLSSIRDTDYIYVLNRGSIIEQGTHLELMKNRGWYFESIQ